MYFHKRVASTQPCAASSMVSPNTRVVENCELAIRSLEEIGYAGLIERRYEFPDYFSPQTVTRTAAAVAFCQTPHSYANACFGVVAANGKSGRGLVSDFRALGAPRLLEIRESSILHWRVGVKTSDCFLDEEYPAEELANVFRNNRDFWKPDEVLRLKNFSAPSPRQTDFIDAGLIPALEEHVKQKLGPLLQRVIVGAESAYVQKHGQQINRGQLIRLVFRGLAGKVMNDRGILAIGRLPPDADSLIATVDEHYNDRTTTIDDKSIRQFVIDRIWDSVSLKNISVEVLAYIWETAFVTDEYRADRAIHATPPSIARYITRRLPLQAIPEANRRVVEPCCGSGTFLVAALNRLRELLPLTMSGAARHEYLKSMLSGFDIDEFGLEIARSCLMLADFPNPNGWNLRREDVLDTTNAHHFVNALGSAGVVLCNPPFGEFSDDKRIELNPSSVFKQIELFNTTLLNLAPEALLGFVMPLQFCTGASYRTSRKLLAGRFDEVEIVTLPDRVFATAEQETALVIAKSRRRTGSRPVDILHRKVVENAAWRRFNKHFSVSREESDRREIDECADSFAIPDLNDVWRFLSDGETIKDAISLIGRGIEWDALLDESRDLLISSTPGEGYLPGIPSAPRGTFVSYQRPPTAYLNVTDDLQKTPYTFALPWRLPKVVMNSKRRSRYVWRNTAFADEEGFVCYQTYTVLWPSERWRPNVLAAVINGYVANAFVTAHESNRDITNETIKDIPIPRLDSAQIQEIDDLVREYVSVVENVAGLFSESRDGGARDGADILNEIDAVVLRAYCLPAHLMSDLLKYFSGQAKYRKVAVDFDGPSESLFRFFNKRAGSFIRDWAAEDSDYDHQAWPTVKCAIEQDRLSARKRFHE